MAKKKDYAHYIACFQAGKRGKRLYKKYPVSQDDINLNDRTVICPACGEICKLSFQKLIHVN